jgi:hypothetical protein
MKYREGATSITTNSASTSANLLSHDAGHSQVRPVGTWMRSPSPRSSASARPSTRRNAPATTVECPNCRTESRRPCARAWRSGIVTRNVDAQPEVPASSAANSAPLSSSIAAANAAGVRQRACPAAADSTRPSSAATAAIAAVCLVQQPAERRRTLPASFTREPSAAAGTSARPRKANAHDS